MRVSYHIFNSFLRKSVEIWWVFPWSPQINYFVNIRPDCAQANCWESVPFWRILLIFRIEKHPEQVNFVKFGQKWRFLGFGVDFIHPIDDLRKIFGWPPLPLLDFDTLRKKTLRNLINASPLTRCTNTGICT